MKNIRTDSEIIGQFIAAMRKEKGLTQKQLAKKLNVSDKTVSKWERAVCLPDILLIVPLSEELGVTSTELLSGERLLQGNAYNAFQIDGVLKDLTQIHKNKALFIPVKKSNSILIVLNTLCFLAFVLFFAFAYFTITNIQIIDEVYYPVVGPTFSVLGIILIGVNALILILTLLFFNRKSFIYVFSVVHFLSIIISTLYFRSALFSLDTNITGNMPDWLLECAFIYGGGVVLAVILNVFAWYKFYRKNDI